MKRPVGVTVIAVVNIWGAFILAVGKGGVPTQQMHGVILGIVISVVLFSLGVSVGLFGLRNWARSITVFFSWLSLISAIMFPVREGLTGRKVVDVSQLLGGLFAGWVLWYLSKPEVIAAFRLRESVEWRESLNIRYRPSATEGATVIVNPSKQDVEPGRNGTTPVSVTLFGRDIPMRDPRE